MTDPCQHLRLSRTIVGETAFYKCSDGWRPMETAPRDGTRIIVDFGRIGIHAVSWTVSTSGSEIWCVDDLKFGPYALRRWIETDVRGWMPLPKSAESCGRNFTAEPLTIKVSYPEPRAEDRQ